MNQYYLMILKVIENRESLWFNETDIIGNKNLSEDAWFLLMNNIEEWFKDIVDDTHIVMSSNLISILKKWNLFDVCFKTAHLS